jgi:hypothetical protein
MLCMSPRLTLLLLPWEISCTGYWIGSHRLLAISLVSAQKCSKLISKIRKFVFLLYTTTKNGQGRGGVSGHIHLTRRGASTLSSQTPHRYDPRCIIAQWTDLSVLCSREL